MDPLVSVIIPSYNHSQFVRQSIESVINQTYKNIELIVIDDASKDNSPDILRELQKQYGFFLVCREKNKGLSATLNEAINNYAHGEYIRCLASDDYWPETSVADLVNYVKEHSEVALVFGWGYDIDSHANILGEIGKINGEQDINFENLLTDNFILAPAVMFTKKVFVEQGGFDENLAIEDWDLWLRFFYNNYSIGYFSQRSLAFYRNHGNNTVQKVELMIKTRSQIFGKWKDKIPINTYNKLYSIYICKYFKRFSGNNKKVALKLLLKYQFKYIDMTVLKDIAKGFFKLCFYWK